jgi:hypothetical protein
MSMKNVTVARIFGTAILAGSAVLGIAAPASAAARPAIVQDCSFTVTAAAPFYATPTSTIVLQTLPKGDHVSSKPFMESNSRIRVELPLDGITGWVPARDLGDKSCT